MALWGILQDVSLLTILVVNLGILQCQAYGEYGHVIYIDSRKGSDSVSCINSSVNPCQNLDWALLPEYRTSYTKYVLLNSGPHQLHGSITIFLNVSTMAFIGSEANTTIHCIGEETGLAFINSSGLAFVNITFIGCESTWTSTSRSLDVTKQLRFLPFIQVSLYFYHCRYVSVTNVRVESTGSRETGMILFASSRTNTIVNASFVKCIVEPRDGGSFTDIVEFYCVLGDVHCLENGDDFLLSQNTGTSDVFKNDFSLNHNNDVELLPCPPGFKSSDKSETRNATNRTTCVCASNYQESLTCYQDSMTAYLNNNNWMGPSPEQDNSNYVAVICPPGYCYTNFTSGTFLLPNNTEDLDRLVCGTQNRTGIVCGECIEGFGPAINSRTYECVNCSDHNVVRGNIAKYVFSVYIPLAILFTILILFDIRLTTGPANAFILYCQVVTTTFDLDADGQLPLNLVTNYSSNLLNVYRFPYGIFNLEFVEKLLPSLCVGTNLNALSVMLMNYAVALAPILMIVLVLLCVKLTAFVTGKYCRGDVMHLFRVNFFTRFTAQSRTPQRHRITEAILPAFAAFLLLSYNKFSTTSTFLVGSQPLLRDDGSAISPRRVYYAGQYSTDDSEYCLHYLLPAVIIFSTFVIIPPLLLLDYPLRVFEWCLSKVNCLWKYYRVDKVHVFLDTFQGCYKNKMRFFAGLYFLFRLVINVAYLSTDTWLEQFAVQQVACVIMIMLLALCRPYKKKWLNYVDILIFTNLAVLNSVSFYLYSFSQINPQTRLPPSAFAVQYILVLLPLFYMISYVAWSLTQSCHHSIKRHLRIAFTSLMRNARLNRYRNLENFSINATQTTSEYGSTLERQNTGSDIEEIFERAEEQNTYKKLNQCLNVVKEKDGTSPERCLSPNVVVKGYGSGGHTQSQTY